MPGAGLACLLSGESIITSITLVGKPNKRIQIWENCVHVSLQKKKQSQKIQMFKLYSDLTAVLINFIENIKTLKQLVSIHSES